MYHWIILIFSKELEINFTQSSCSLLSSLFSYTSWQILTNLVNKSLRALRRGGSLVSIPFLILGTSKITYIANTYYSGAFSKDLKSHCKEVTVLWSVYIVFKNKTYSWCVFRYCARGNLSGGSLIWFGMSGSSLSLECFSNCGSLNTSACTRTYSDIVVCLPKGHSPSMKTEPSLWPRVFPQCGQGRWAPPPGQDWFSPSW